ncbi:phosphodiesterase [Herbaspirillum sp. meg3]|uniref:HD-GYP domain-containing protein n=1 Tax=Herbaspirillum sp. meg3 TaxID=2025949 RepID=UPI000B97F81B|nr:HD-GYP domain-containing protein [Herbaspirillum sp. meg3]ASU40125.1 phosphodiesterase [Herbaspirillum sp. meg3]
MSHLKKISVNNLVPGMYFSGFDGPWIDNPFWKNKFLITNHKEIKQAQTSGFEHCWIDVSKGKDVQESSLTAEEHELLGDIASGLSEESLDLLYEVEDAKRLYDQAKEITQTMFKQVRLGRAIDTAECLRLVDEIAASVTRGSSILTSVVRLKQADEYSYIHSVAVCALMVSLGKTLGMDDASCKEAGLAGYLHDVGKAFIPLEVLNKPGKLTDPEFRIVQRHPTLGYEYLRGDPKVPDYASTVCLHHHEKLDGSGYPGKQQGNAITIYARMAAICDVYDAITSDRPYKQGWDPAESIAQMASWDGHFDRPMFLAFVRTLGIYPVGSIVKLKSGRRGLVIKQNHNDLTKPVVKAFTISDAFEVLHTELVDLGSTSTQDGIAERSGEDWLKLKGLSMSFVDHMKSGIADSRAISVA